MDVASHVAGRLKTDPAIRIGVDDGASVEISGIRFSGIASAHETVERDEHSWAKYLGYVLEFGGWTIYHSGDTARYEGMAEKLRSFRTDVALRPINGRALERRFPGNLFGREAAQLAKTWTRNWLYHFEIFEFNSASPEEFIDECRKLGHPFKVLRRGEQWCS